MNVMKLHKRFFYAGNFLFFLLFCAGFGLLLSARTNASKAEQKTIQNEIANQVIRFHVIANSDSDPDQALKLKVRDAVIGVLRSSLANSSSAREAEQLLDQEKQLIGEVASYTISMQGYDYPVRVSLENRYFPVKTYGDLTFPEGEYRALCIEIGKAKGHNWWCVLFPSLCFVDETTCVVPQKSKETLQDSLSETAYSQLSVTKNPQSTKPQDVEFHSALYDFWTRKSYTTRKTGR